MPTSIEMEPEPNTRRPALLRRAWLAWLFALASGCGGEPDLAPRFPASGTVLVNGRPAEGVQIMLHPIDRPGDLDALKPTAISTADGTFQLGTYEKGDGAPAGRYNVTLFLPDVPPNGANSPNDVLGGRYLNPEKTPFEATIDSGENRLGPFEAAGAARSPRTPRKPDSDGVG